MSLLSEMRDKLTKSLTVFLELNALNDQLLNNIQDVIETNNQKYPMKNCTLRFKIRDEAMLVEMPSKTFKVNPSDDLMADILSVTNAAPVLN
jgi:DNA polymerase-3 subunit alpha